MATMYNQKGICVFILLRGVFVMVVSSWNGLLPSCAVLVGLLHCPAFTFTFSGGTTSGGQQFSFLSDETQVIVEVEGMDKAGNFIGWLQVDGVNLSVALVEHALSKVHFSAERSTYYKALMSAEEAAQQTKSKVWSDYTEKHAEEENMALVEDTERNTAYRPVIITEVTDNLHFYIQDVETGAQLEKLMENMRADIAANPPLPGSFTPRRGHYCISQFTDNEWYRAKIEKIEGPGRVQVFYVDYGNRESVPASRLGTLPGDYSLQAFPAQAHEYAFAFIQVPDDEEARSEAVDCLVRDVQNSQCLLNVEYRGNTCEHVTLLLPESREDVGLGLMREGMVIVEKRKEKRFTKLVADYQKAQDGAKASRMNIWRYGDFTSDDAVEFGYSR